MTGPGFVKLMRTDKSVALMADPRAFTLASIIAYRAQRTNSLNIYGLQAGEALLGDYKSYGMTEQEYRQAKSRKVFFRAEPPFYAKLTAAAKRAGKPVATWIHDTLAQLLKGE